jgi:hypothetical protein
MNELTGHSASFSDMGHWTADRNKHARGITAMWCFLSWDGVQLQWPPVPVIDVATYTYRL